jgi:GTP-binding protein Era
MADTPSPFRCGFVAIVGAPNAGKSTLLNRLLGEKLAITSRKPQTTRNRILGVLQLPGAQVILVDTPGVHRAAGALNRHIVATALAALQDADLALWVVDCTAPDEAAESVLSERLQGVGLPLVLALNKIDRLPDARIPAIADQWRTRFPAGLPLPVSAKHGTGLEDLVGVLERRLPVGAALFPADQLTDLPLRFLVAEMVREKIFRLTGQEVPYATAVTIERFVEAANRRQTTFIDAVVHVERESQKGILIGRGGERLKRIGQEARLDMERLIGGRVMLKLFVRVEKNWSGDRRTLQRFGYG